MSLFFNRPIAANSLEQVFKYSGRFIVRLIKKITYYMYQRSSSYRKTIHSVRHQIYISYLLVGGSICVQRNLIKYGMSLKKQ